VRRADLVAAVLLLALAGGYLKVALEFPYIGPHGPGSGFLPVWLGIALGVLSVLMLVGALRAAPGGGEWLPDRRGMWRLAITLGAAVIFVSLLEIVGMVLGCALFLVAILRFFEGYPWKHTLGIAAGAGLGIYLLFIRWLNVPFPIGFLGF